MRILFADQELAGFAHNPAQQVRVNGQIVFMATEILNAPAKKLTPLGNLSTEISFTARREFDTIKEAEVFLLTHFAGLTKQGTAQIQCGVESGDYTPVYFANALLTAVPRAIYEGVGVEMDYTILAGVPSLAAL